MKKIGTMIALALTLLASDSTDAQNYKTALGIRLSSNAAVVNNSVSFKYFFNERIAGEALLSFDPFALGGLVELHHPIGTNGLSWLYGGGLFVGFSGERNLGAMGVLGLDYRFPGLPINLTFDWKPELSFTREFSFEPAAVGLSARFVFR